MACVLGLALKAQVRTNNAFNSFYVLACATAKTANEWETTNSYLWEDLVSYWKCMLTSTTCKLTFKQRISTYCPHLWNTLSPPCVRSWFSWSHQSISPICICHFVFLKLHFILCVHIIFLITLYLLSLCVCLFVCSCIHLSIHVDVRE